MHEGSFRRIEINHADRIGNVIGHPEFTAIGTNGQADRIKPDGNASHQSSGLGIQDFDRIARRISHKNLVFRNHNRRKMGTHKGWMPDFPLSVQ